MGIGTSTAAPDDPALARLFPDGYTDDAEASADFRRYTEPGLRTRSGRPCRPRSAMLGRPGRGRRCSTEQAEQWLRALNDTRLVLGSGWRSARTGTRCSRSCADDDPRLPLFWVYDRLTYLEESLVQALW